MRLWDPTFDSLAVVCINSYTGRHIDRTDEKNGFPGLLALWQYQGGQLAFPQLALRVTYQLGDAVIFSGSELEHFVCDWTGYRIFLLYTNHQPVPNYAERILGTRLPKPNDPWHPDRQKNHTASLVQLSITDTSAYDPCFDRPTTPTPEDLTEADIHGPAFVPDDATTTSSGGTPIRSPSNSLSPVPEGKQLSAAEAQTGIPGTKNTSGNAPDVTNRAIAVKSYMTRSAKRSQSSGTGVSVTPSGCDHEPCAKRTKRGK